jgi:hypothetical protein
VHHLLRTVRKKNFLAFRPPKALSWRGTKPNSSMKNEAAQALGRLKKGVKEKPSERKRAASAASLIKAREAKRLKNEKNLNQEPG